MENIMRANLQRAKNTEKEYTHGQMETYMMETFNWIKDKDSVYITGQIRECTEDNGEQTEWTGTGVLSKMVSISWDNFLLIILPGKSMKKI